MAKVVAIGPPANDSEKMAIAHLRDNLPLGYTILHNLEISQGSEIFEIDLIIIAPHCVFVVDTKGTQANVEVYGSKWYPSDRQPFHSPLAKLRQHAKVVKSLISTACSHKHNISKVHVHAAVIMTSPTAQIIDSAGLDGPDVTYLTNCISYFQSASHIPANRIKDIRTLASCIESAIRGKAKPKPSAVRYRDWQIEEKLGGDNRYTEYRARNLFAGKSAGTARLRVYQVDPYEKTEVQAEQRKVIGNSYRALAKIPSHRNILSVREFFPTEDEDKLILVTEDVAGNALQQHLKRSDIALTFDQKISIITDVLTALNHAHQYSVVHRNISPDSILVGADGTARLAAFDYARVGINRQSTIAGDVVDDLDTRFQAPEAYRDPAQATSVSDLFSAGLVFYELLTGEIAFNNTEQMFDLLAVFSVKPSELKTDLPFGIDDWLQKLCAFNPAERFPNASQASQELSNLLQPEVNSENSTIIVKESKSLIQVDLNNLSRRFVLADRFHVEERLGEPGAFAVAYKVYDNIADITRVIKLVTKDRHSVFDRLKREYQTLSHIPRHPNVVEVLWADLLPDETPYILFEYIEGLDVEQLISQQSISIEDAVRIARESAIGLQHLHQNGVYHQDIKPSNLLWTQNGVRIIDFNVALTDRDPSITGGGTRRYIPPDFDFTDEASVPEKIDRDVYALAVTFYESLTNNYPFTESTPPINGFAQDPRFFDGCAEVSDRLVDLLQKALSPKRQDRFDSAQSFLESLNNISSTNALRKPKPLKTLTKELLTAAPFKTLIPHKPNFNPFVSYLLTLYSQSQQTNAGTRGLDSIGELTYVPTLLDTELQPAILNGEFNLVIISGNAGDGKTAFVQKLERQAEIEQASFTRQINGSIFNLRNRKFFTNYDGSQDEGEKVNDDVLLEFFNSFTGSDNSKWITDQTKIIAINEGRLVDFLLSHEHRFPHLIGIVKKGLNGSELNSGVAVINLNLRSVVTDLKGDNSSIFDRLINKFTDSRFWEACKSCDIQDRCYIYHNAQTFMDETAGIKAIERLKTIHTITHLRGKLHITLRDLRSALSFMIAGTRNCDEVHKLYESNDAQDTQNILDGYYFNAWMGGGQESADRLINLLSEIDVGEVSNPEIDRYFALLDPDNRELNRFNFAERNTYVDALLQKVFNELPNNYSSQLNLQRQEAFKSYVSMMRRRFYFERRDENWREMLPHKSSAEFLSLILKEQTLKPYVAHILSAINRGEGLQDISRLGQKLALRVRQVSKGTIKSYRLFDKKDFVLELPRSLASLRFIEYMPQTFLLTYHSPNGQHQAELTINLDIFEMLEQLNEGYIPSIEQQEGFYRNLTVFKNLLGSAPYQEVLLTETGHDFYQIKRSESGVLSLQQLQGAITS